MICLKVVDDDNNAIEEDLESYSEASDVVLYLESKNPSKNYYIVPQED